MMEMMNETNQNTYAAHVGGPVGGCEYLSLLDLLDAANYTDEQRIFGLIKKLAIYAPIY